MGRAGSGSDVAGPLRKATVREEGAGDIRADSQFNAVFL